MIHPRTVTRHGDHNLCKKGGLKTFTSNIVLFQFSTKHNRLSVLIENEKYRIIYRGYDGNYNFSNQILF